MINIPNKGLYKEKSVEAKDYLAKLESEKRKQKTYVEKRIAEYPSIGDMVDAICKNLNGNSTEFDRLSITRRLVKDKYPKS